MKEVLVIDIYITVQDSAVMSSMRRPRRGGGR